MTCTLPNWRFWVNPNCGMGDLEEKYTEMLPSPANLRQQYLSFCRDFHAQGVIGYTWHDNTVDGLPDTNATLAEGVREGNQACRDNWKGLPSPHFAGVVKRFWHFW
jgi:hypothetical protein